MYYALAMEVEVLAWPRNDERRAHLRAVGLPRLLVLEPGVPAPPDWDDLEDWVRAPIDDGEAHARAERLQARARRGAVPVIDSSDLVTFAGARLALSPLEARLMRALTEAYGSVVTSAALAAQIWPDGPPARDNALYLHVLRLRRRIEPLGLAIRSARGRGYLLEAGGRR